MNGMHAKTGRHLSGTDHIAQSVADILTTPIGTRRMRFDYGSILHELIDQPLNGTTVQRLYGAIATAIQTWEPRILLTQLGVVRNCDHTALTVTIDGRLRNVPNQDALRITLPFPLNPGVSDAQ